MVHILSSAFLTKYLVKKHCMLKSAGGRIQSSAQDPTSSGYKPHTHVYRNLKIPHEEIEGTLENCKSVIISFIPIPPDPLKEPNLGRLMVARGADSNQAKRFLKGFWSGQKCLSD